MIREIRLANAGLNRLFVETKTKKEMMRVLSHMTKHTDIIDNSVQLDIPKGYGVLCIFNEHFIRKPRKNEYILHEKTKCF